jgi:IS30 family transposase
MGKTNIYVFDFGDMVKIGVSGNVQNRLKTIENQSGRKALRFFSIEADQGYENLIHRLFSSYRGIGEYFSIPFDFATSILQSLITNNFIKNIKKQSQLLLPINSNALKYDVAGIKTVFYQGYTISEMTKFLNVPRKTIEMRLLRKKHKPISYESLYSQEAFNDIKESPGRGRPKKQK